MMRWFRLKFSKEDWIKYYEDQDRIVVLEKRFNNHLRILLSVQDRVKILEEAGSGDTFLDSLKREDYYDGPQMG